MSLDHILLGMLRRPLTGYDLGREFAESARHFWFAEKSQIYPTMKRMRERGWLKTWEEPSERGPRRKVHQTTEEGKAELRRWLRDGPHIGTERLAFVAQTFFLGELKSCEESLGTVRKMRAMWETKLSYLEYEERLIREEYGDVSSMDIDGVHYHAALRLGLRTLRARIAWADETMKVLLARVEAEAQPGVAAGSDATGRDA